MKHLLRTLMGLVLAAMLAPVVSAQVIPADATNVREVKIFRNVSGATQPSGTAYVLQDNNTDSNVLVGADFGQSSTLGLDVTTTTSGDSDDFVGCQLDDSVLDDQLVRIVTWGPAICKWAGSTDNTNTRLAEVGTTTVAGHLGSGTLAGQLLSLTLPSGNTAATQDTVGTTGGEINGTQDNENRWIWIRPSN